MKETEPIYQDTLQVSDVKPIKKELKLIGKIKPHKGHTCYQLSLETGQITKAVFESVDVDFKKASKGDMSAKKKVIIKPGHLYCSALNVGNAKKRFVKMLLKYQKVK